MAIFKKSSPVDPETLTALGVGVPLAVGHVTLAIQQHLANIKKEKEQALRDLQEIEYQIKKVKKLHPELESYKTSDKTPEAKSNNFLKLSFGPQEIFLGSMGVASAGMAGQFVEYIRHLLKTRKEKLNQLERLSRLEEKYKAELESDNNY